MPRPKSRVPPQARAEGVKESGESTFNALKARENMVLKVEGRAIAKTARVSSKNPVNSTGRLCILQGIKFVRGHGALDPKPF